ncbi:HutD family protein [Nocardia sp. R6R-6]|uniref:HutD family protein n=1 Tax=Nocardia sp. R6R-6 TaxID=3459303 RepID=UPI00403D6E48
MPNTVFTVHASDRRITPWVNGSGVTGEIARGTIADSGLPTWRLSVAELSANAQFSPLPGIGRVFTVVGQHPVTLRFADTSQHLLPCHPFAFHGEQVPFCEVTGPTEAFNVMVDRDSAKAEVDALQVADRHIVRTSPDSMTALFLAAGAGYLDEQPAGPGDCFLWPGGGEKTFSGCARLVIARITALDDTTALIGSATTELET